MDRSEIVELLDDLLWFSNQFSRMRGGIDTSAPVIFAYWRLPNIH